MNQITSKKRTFSWAGALCVASLCLSSCAHRPPNPYEQTSATQLHLFKKVALPFRPGTPFKISQGAFGWATHHDKGHEYTWDFDVPYGTPVTAVEAGTVIAVWAPDDTGGGCDPVFSERAHNVKVRHADGTVAQYVHVRSRVRVGQVVQLGETIADTAQNGFICQPQLDFGVYQDDQHLFGSDQMRTIPLRFEGLPGDGIARQGYRRP